jgi:hypothetical protein
MSEFKRSLKMKFRRDCFLLYVGRCIQNDFKWTIEAKICVYFVKIAPPKFTNTGATHLICLHKINFQVYR